MIIIYVSENNQTVNHTKGGSNNFNLSLNDVEIGLVIYQVCAEAFP